MFSWIVPSSSTCLYSARSYLADSLSTSASLLTKTCTSAVSAPGSMSCESPAHAVPAPPSSSAVAATVVSDRLMIIQILLNPLDPRLRTAVATLR